MFDSIITAVWNRILDGLAVFVDYMFVGEMWVGVAILALAAGYVAVMVPWQWLRGALGYIVTIAIAVAAGAQLMFNRMRREKVEHDARQEPKDPQYKNWVDKNDGRWF